MIMFVIVKTAEMSCLGPLSTHYVFKRSSYVNIAFY